MATGKTTTLTFDIGPALPEKLRAAADRKQRPITNAAEVPIREQRARNEVTIHEQAALFSGDDTSPYNR